MDLSYQKTSNNNDGMKPRSSKDTGAAFRRADRFQRPGFLAGFLSIGFVLVVILGVILSTHEMRIDTLDSTGIQVLNEGVLCDIDCNGFVDNQFKRFIEIKGWCVIPGKETRPIALHALLKEKKSDVYHKLPTSVEVREDVTKSIDDGVNYDNSGFIAYVDWSRIKHKKYEICVLYECAAERFLIQTGQYLDVSTGEMK